MPPGLPKLIGFTWSRSAFVTASGGLPVTTAANTRCRSSPALIRSAMTDRRPNWAKFAWASAASSMAA